MRTLFLNLLAASLLMMFSTLVESKQDESLVLYLSFDEGKGDVTNDLSQYKNNGAMQGKAKWVDGKSGKALLFDGSSNVEVPHDDTLNLEGAHTISYWLKEKGLALAGLRLYPKPLDKQPTSIIPGLGLTMYGITKIPTVKYTEKPLSPWIMSGYF